MGQRRHICCCEGCRSWVLAHYFCCHQHRAIMGPELYEEARAIWERKPFEAHAWGEVLAKINIKTMQAHRETQAMLGKTS